MKKLKFLMLALLVSYSSISWAQSEITGVVVDDQNVPLPGANVVVKGSSRGVVTDFDGHFKIEASIGDILEISYIGMTTQQVVVENNSSLTVVLQTDATVLDDVVVVGYGTQKIKDVTGAVKRVTSEEFNKGVVTNPGQLIQGKAAGLMLLHPVASPVVGSESLFVDKVLSVRGPDLYLFWTAFRWDLQVRVPEKAL